MKRILAAISGLLMFFGSGMAAYYFAQGDILIGVACGVVVIAGFMGGLILVLN